MTQIINPRRGRVTKKEIFNAKLQERLAHKKNDNNLKGITPLSLQDKKMWVGWREELIQDKNGKERKTKVPYNPLTNTKADATDPTTWGTRPNRGIGSRVNPRIKLVAAAWSWPAYQVRTGGLWD